jgi:hypothetical protein
MYVNQYLSIKKARLIIVAAMLVLTSCSKGDSVLYRYDEPTIYSSSDEVAFSELILFLKPVVYEGVQKKYVVADRLRNIVVKVNNRAWTAPASYELDTLHTGDRSTLGRYRVTSEPVSYPVQIDVVSYPEAFRTAGEYADLLNNYFYMPPGAYICQVSSFDVPSISGTATIYTPSISFPIEIKAGQRSLSIGEFEVVVTN